MGMISLLNAHRWSLCSQRPWVLYANHAFYLPWLSGVLLTVQLLLGVLHYRVVESLSEVEASIQFAGQGHPSLARSSEADTIESDQFDIFWPHAYPAWPSLFALSPRKQMSELPANIADTLPEASATIPHAVSPPGWQLQIQHPIATFSQLENAMLRAQQYLAIADDVQARQALNDVLLMDAYHVEALMAMVALLKRTGEEGTLQYYQNRLYQQLPQGSAQPMDDVEWREGLHD